MATSRATLGYCREGSLTHRHSPYVNHSIFFSVIQPKSLREFHSEVVQLSPVERSVVSTGNFPILKTSWFFLLKLADWMLPNRYLLVPSQQRKHKHNKSLLLTSNRFLHILFWCFHCWIWTSKCRHKAHGIREA